MSEIERMCGEMVIPKFRKIRYNFDTRSIEDIPAAVRETLKREGTLDRIQPGKTVCLTASSREVNHQALILKTVAEVLKEKGAEPFIIPAMGSHGGATAEGQREILTHFGITEEYCGVPIYDEMDTIIVGKTVEDLDVHMSKRAAEADYVIPIGRIKPHPEFRGPYESGVMKMIAVGLGKRNGAEIAHSMGMHRMSESVYNLAKGNLAYGNIPFGIGIIENALHGTYSITAIPAELIEEEEPKLLQTAKSVTPVIPFEKVDVLICEQMGKDISGTGMDSNVIGRSISLGISRPFIERIGLLSLTEKTGGSFNGIALGDCISRKLFDALIFEKTYPNSITACEPLAVKIPIVLNNDKLCVQCAIRCCLQAPPTGHRIVWIKDTLSVHEFFISETLVEATLKNPELELLPGRFEPKFDENDNYVCFEEIQ